MFESCHEIAESKEDHEIGVDQSWRSLFIEGVILDVHPNKDGEGEYHEQLQQYEGDAEVGERLVGFGNFYRFDRLHMVL